MAGLSISGLGAGLDTAAIVQQLMAAEKIGLDRLAARKDVQDNRVAAWRDIDGKLAAFKEAVRKLADSTGVRAATASTSRAESLTATAADTAPTGSYAVRVLALASAKQAKSDGFDSAADVVGPGRVFIAGPLGAIGGSLVSEGTSAGKHTVEVTSVADGFAEVTYGGLAQTVPSSGRISLVAGDGSSLELDVAVGLRVGRASVAAIDTDEETTLAALATQINDLSLGVTAAAVDRNDGAAHPVSFVLSANGSGVDNAFEADFSGLAGFAARPLTTFHAATNAQVSLGAGAVVAQRSTNRITDLIPGVTLDLLAADPAQDLTVTVAKASAKAADSVSAAVTALNATIAAVKKQTDIDTVNKRQGPLAHDVRARDLGFQLTSAMGANVAGGSLSRLNQVGVTVQRDGGFLVDTAKLKDALEADHDEVVRLLSGDGDAVSGVFDSVLSRVDSIRGTSGVVQTAIGSAESIKRSLDADMLDYQARMNLVERRLRDRFTAMEATMGKLNAQAGRLASMLGQ